MKSYIIYKNQTEGLGDVSETVKTVEKIAASAVHFLRQKVSALDAYTAETEKALARLSLFYRKEGHPLLRERREGERALVVLTGDKGLVGGLWHKIVNAVLENPGRHQSFIAIGAKGGNYLKEENASAPVMPFAGFSDAPEEEEIKSVTDYIFGEFKKGNFSRVDILHPGFVSLTEQLPVFTPFLPFEFGLAEEAGSGESGGGRAAAGEGLPIFEPSKQELFDELLRKYIGVFFRKIIMETKLSEFSARTVAMERAASKTGELIKKLKVDYAKERRRRITQGQMESFAAHKTLKR
ncbi:MAG: hypothetical protein GXP44_00055 [bacterium]|nr:hypothetical protein [bacterium]